MGEMVARSMDGQLVIGLLGCNCKGEAVLTFKVADDLTKPDDSIVEKSQSRDLMIAAALVGGALMYKGAL